MIVFELPELKHGDRLARVEIMRKDAAAYGSG
jgi:hypothetical protein